MIEFCHPQHTLTDRPSADLWDIGIGLGRIVAIERAAAADADIWTGFRSGRNHSRCHAPLVAGIPVVLATALQGRRG